MGLFTSKKNPCPICGAPTPRLFPTKVDGIAICSDCAVKIDLPDGVLDGMTLNDFQEYIACFDDNEPLRDQFQATFCFGKGFLDDGLQLDEGNQLFRLRGAKYNFAFPASDLVSFKITEDERTLFEGNASGLRVVESDVDRRLDDLRMAIELHMDRYRKWENWERLRNALDKEEADRRRNEYEKPRFNSGPPVEKFHVYVKLNHRYWKNFEEVENGPRFDTEMPSIMDYQIQYEEKVTELRELAEKLMAMINPSAPVFEPNAGNAYSQAYGAPGQPVQAAPQMDAVTEIQRYKALLDAGIITEDEFAAKKRQLLGI